MNQEGQPCSFEQIIEFKNFNCCSQTTFVSTTPMLSYGTLMYDREAEVFYDRGIFRDALEGGPVVPSCPLGYAS